MIKDASQEKSLIQQENYYFIMLLSAYGEPNKFQEYLHHIYIEEREG